MCWCLVCCSRAKLISSAAKRLDACRMIRFHEDSGNLAVTTLGRVASHFYIQHESVETFNDMLKPSMTDAKIVDIVCHAQVRFGGLQRYMATHCQVWCC